MYTCGEDGNVRAWKLPSDGQARAAETSNKRDKKDKRKEKKEKLRLEDESKKSRFTPY